jgi:hypothetical protein
MPRRVNEYTADLVAKRPDRFGNFVTVPLPDVDGALSERVIEARPRVSNKEKPENEPCSFSGH